MAMSYEKLRVYQFSLQFLSFAGGIIERLPRGNGPIADQFRRAAASVCLNTAEACGRIRDADRKRHFAIARGSAMECGAVLDVLNELKIIDPILYRNQKQRLTVIVAMLSKLARTSQFEQEQEQEQEQESVDDRGDVQVKDEGKGQGIAAAIIPLGR